MTAFFTPLPGIPELYFGGVFERGIPGKERIVLKSLDLVNMGEFCLLVGFSQFGAANTATPFNNQFFWFGNGLVQKDEWIHVYTGRGKPSQGVGTVSKEKIYSVYWGAKNTLFHQEQTTPLLLRFGGISLPAIDDTYSSNIISE